MSFTYVVFRDPSYLEHRVLLEDVSVAVWHSMMVLNMDKQNEYHILTVQVLSEEEWEIIFRNLPNIFRINQEQLVELLDQKINDINENLRYGLANGYYEKDDDIVKEQKRLNKEIISFTQNVRKLYRIPEPPITEEEIPF